MPPPRDRTQGQPLAIKPGQPQAIKPGKPPISHSVPPTIVFEDEWLLAIDKPAGLLAHGESADRTALAWAQEREVERGADPAQLHLVHRLDRETSGVLLFARGAVLAEAVNALFRDRKVLKVYVALCSPVPALRWFKAEQRLLPVRIGSGEKMHVVAEGGVAATSEIEVLARGRRLGLVRVIPDQGRKHQVRVALAASGSPIAGDFLYGGPLSKHLAPRVMLHARTLELQHPQTEAHLVLRAPLPADLKTLLHADGAAVPQDLDVRHRVQPAKHGRDRSGPLDAGQAAAYAKAVPQPRSYAKKAKKSPG